MVLNFQSGKYSQIKMDEICKFQFLELIKQTLLPNIFMLKTLKIMSNTDDYNAKLERPAFFLE